MYLLIDMQLCIQYLRHGLTGMGYTVTITYSTYILLMLYEIYFCGVESH